MMKVKYTWRELSEDGLLKKFKSNYLDYYYFDDEYDSEEEAISDFEATFGNRQSAITNCVLVKLYGTWK